MNTDLFKIAKADINKDFEQFKKLVCFCITSFASDLYFPMLYFGNQNTNKEISESFLNSFSNIRQEVFDIRQIIENTKNTQEFKEILSDGIMKLQDQYDNLIYLLACMSPPAEWIGKANLNKNVSGVLKATTNETLGLIHFLKDTSKQLNKE